MISELNAVEENLWYSLIDELMDGFLSVSVCVVLEFT